MLLNPDMPWNEEIRATWARWNALRRAHGPLRSCMPLMTEMDVRAVLPTIRVPTLVVHHTDDPFIPPAKGKYVAEHIPDAKYVELPGRNVLPLRGTVARLIPGGRPVSHRRAARGGR